MKIKLLVDNPRLNEMAGFLLLLGAIGLLLCLASYSPEDPSANVARAPGQAGNWMGIPGAYSADFILQLLGLVGFSLPVWLAMLGWNRVRQAATEELLRRAGGIGLLSAVLCCTLQMVRRPIEAILPDRWDQSIKAGGALGRVLAEASISVLNIGGTMLLLAALTAVGGYMLTSAKLTDLFRRSKKSAADEGEDEAGPEQERPAPPVIPVTSRLDEDHTLSAQPATPKPPRRARRTGNPGPAAGNSTIAAPAVPPIVELKETSEGADEGSMLEAPGDGPAPATTGSRDKRSRAPKPAYTMPSTSLLNAPLGGEPYDADLLQETGRQIVEKFEEFGVLGSVNQINPGPVVTTFEFKPDRGMKVSKIVNLSEDLCLALECESILVERIPGKSTVGIEVPNRKREVISFREVVETPVFRQSGSMLTFALGKDINGKIHCTDLAGMPHLLVAGQTGSGKSVMVNTVIMSILLRATPEDVRFILVDPKTVELTLYRDIPHLLTPVITDMKEATNALKNATREMERRLQLLAKYGVRNISQFNEKVRRAKQGGSLPFKEQEELEKLPYIVVIVDELADLMILAGRQVEESIQRLAQMARAVGIHLLLATQRPSVDVITGLIKANIPARLSFLLATRVDSRTILDSMGAESLLGKGDMLFLPPGTARMRRLHGPLVSEDEIAAIVSHWTDLASPDYQTEYLASPDGDQEESDPDNDPGLDDPMYRDAVKLVLEMGKASTSTLQRRLRLGYGRAARILDAMERDGIIGAQDGSRPREVLKRPDWLDEVETVGTGAEQ